MQHSLRPKPMTDVNVIADEIYLDGQLVGLVVQHGSVPSVVEQFREGLLNGLLFEGSVSHNELIGEAMAKGDPDKLCEVLDDVLVNVASIARGGYISIAKLRRVVEQLKEEVRQ